MKRFLTVFAFIVGAFLVSGPAKADCLKLTAETTYERYPQISEKLIQLMRIEGLCATVDYLPGKRTTNMILNGSADGEVARISFYKDQIGPAALMVETPMFTSEGMIISREENRDVIVNLKGKVGIIRGWVWMEKVIEGLNPDQVIRVDNLDNLNALYQKGRVASILAPIGMIEGYGLHNEPTVKSVIQLNYHLWLSKRHKALVPRVNRMIEKFIAEGGYFIRAIQG
ncbi:MAG: hypothetical protein JJ879_16430 [Sneathiella sp.]|nr:hypothetical protein [Sneathiella sp.]